MRFSTPSWERNANSTAESARTVANVERGTEMTDARLVTVVIPTRDRGRTVIRTLQTLLGNVHPAFEVRVIDQSESDSTQVAVTRLIGDPRVYYIRSRTRGLSAALNVGIAGAVGDLIAITGDDCEVGTEWLGKLTAPFESDHRIGLVFGSVRPGPHDPTLGFVPGSVRQRPMLARSLGDAHLVAGTSASMALRKSVWERLHGFDEMLGVGAPLGAAEDTDLTLRALLRGYFVYETPEAEVVHHGFVRWDQGSHLIQRNWYGTGAAFAKALRQGKGVVLLVLARLAWRWTTGGVSPVAASLGQHLHRWSKLVAFARGMAAGAVTPIDQVSGHYRPRPK